MKTFVDCTYFSFVLENPRQILKECYSTVGYLDKCSHNFNTYFVARTTDSSVAFNHSGLKIFLRKGKTLPKWSIPFRFHNFINSLRPDYILIHGFGYAHYLIFLKLILPKSKILLQCNGFAPVPKGLKKWVYKIADNAIDGYLFTGIENAKPWYDANVFKKEKVFEVMEGGTTFSLTNSERAPHTFVWVGRLNADKDPMTLLKAFAQFLETEPSAKLTMIYHDGDLEKMVQGYIEQNASIVTLFLHHFLKEAAMH